MVLKTGQSDQRLYRYVSHLSKISVPFEPKSSICISIDLPLTIVQWFTWGVSVGYEWLPTVVPL